MKEKIKQFIKENWARLVLILILIIVLCCQGCGSSWKIAGNTVNVNKECHYDSIAHHNDTINHEVRQVP